MDPSSPAPARRAAPNFDPLAFAAGGAVPRNNASANGGSAPPSDLDATTSQLGAGRRRGNDDSESTASGPATGRRGGRAGGNNQSIIDIPQVSDEVGDRIREGFADFLET